MRIKATCNICNESKKVNGQKQIELFAGNHHHNLERWELKTGNHIDLSYNLNNRPEFITGSIKETIKTRH